MKRIPTSSGTAALLLTFLALAPLAASSPEPATVAVRTVAATQEDYAALKERGERDHERGAYALARRAYESAAALELLPEERRWVELRLADCAWRAAAKTNEADTTTLDRAREALEALAKDPEHEEDRDLVWAEAQASLGAFFWTRRNARDWSGWTHYERALAWWAGSSDLERARRRYLDLVFEAVLPPWNRDNAWNRAVYANNVPQEILRNAVRIAEEPRDEATARFLLATSYQRQGQNLAVKGRAEREFLRVLELGREHEWYDDALFQLALHLQGSGRASRDENGTWLWKPDFVGAATLYRRLLAEFQKGESHWVDQARLNLASITGESVWLSVDGFFLPGSEVAYDVSWRNVDEVELTLWRTHLTADLEAGSEGLDDWLNRLPAAGLERVARWTHATGDTGEHRPGNAHLLVEEDVAPGAYLFEARGGSQKARALVLVTDVAVTTKASGRELLAWVTDVESGEPVVGADLVLWQWYHDGSWRVRRAEAETAVDGTHLFELSDTTRNQRYFLAVGKGERQTYATSWGSGRLRPSDQWRIHATTDRSTYRPGHEVRWRVVARHHDGTSFATPAGKELRFTVTDPRGGELEKGTLELDEFGAASGSLATEAGATLGEYTIAFRDARDRHVGQATLFRLEEYELPEYEVTVTAAKDDEGRPARFVLGDTVEAVVDAQYYFGGPVGGATVEVVVYQKPFWFRFPREREYPWLYQDSNPYRWWGGQGQEILRTTTATDEEGRATVTFETPFSLGQDQEYTVEARVVDASRREITGRGSVRVTRTEYAVDVAAEHAIHRPGADVQLVVRALDANGNPVEATGTLEVARERTVELWRGPKGEVKRRRELDGRVPAGWQLQRRLVERDVVATTEVTTSDEGRAAWRFRPDRDGTYVVTWHSVDARDADVRATTSVLVADESTRELGLLPGGVELYVDQDTIEPGQDALFVVATPASGRWVLVTLEGTGLEHHEVVRLDGTAKLLRVPITEDHVPNAWLGAITVFDGQSYQDTEELVVPPTHAFLDVEVTHDGEAYVPGSEGSLSLVVRDRDGEPVSAQFSVAVVDEALAYIQGDYAGDPRQFFHGQRRPLRVNTASSFHHGRYREVRKDERTAGLGEGDLDDNVIGGMSRLGYVGEEMLESAADSAADGFFLGRGKGARAMAPASEPVMAQKEARGNRQDAPGPSGPAEGEEPAVRVRSDFRETALWVADVVTDEDGRATLQVPYPDSTTRWKTTVRGIDTGARVGEATARTRTRQPLIARLQTPRFFLAGDELLLTGNLNNNTEADLAVRVALEVEGLRLLGRLADGELVDATGGVTVPAGDQVRVDWRVAVDTLPESGDARVLLRAVGAEVGDAVERSVPVFAHGIEALVATSGRFEGEELTFPLELPAERGTGSTRLVVQVTPSLAVTMLDALPYLIDYPYGCTEQTLSRFLPSAIVARTLRNLGLSPEDAMTRAFGGVEEAFVGRTHPKGKQALDELDRMTQAGLERLYDFQHADGGWAWWKTGDSDHFMTAYVLWGLSLGRDAGLEVRPSVLENGARWLARELVEEEWNEDLQAWMLHALCVYGGETGDVQTARWIETAYRNLVGRTDRLNAYGRALLVIAAHELGHEEEARALVDVLVDGAIVDETPDTSIVLGGEQRSRDYVLKTAHWGNDGIWRRWSEGGVESTAFVLRALCLVRPDHELVEPTANWLVKNRRGAQWSNTRDTAIVVLALDEYLRASGQLASPAAYEVEVNGTRVAAVELGLEDLLSAPGTFAIDPELVVDGRNEIRIHRSAGTGPLYFAAHATFFSAEEPIPARGNELFVRRDYYRLKPRPTLLAGTVHDRIRLEDGDEVVSGERIQVVLTVETKNDLEYLLFEDLKPAGFEAVQVRSGEPISFRERKRGELEELLEEGRAPRATDGRWRGQGYTHRSRSAHHELRDRNVAVFVDRLPDGLWEITYELRAETPGKFHALPLLGHAMYVPEIRANGEELRLEVRDR